MHLVCECANAAWVNPRVQPRVNSPARSLCIYREK